MKLRITGYFFLILGGVLSVLLVQSLRHDVPIWFFGQKVPATIEETYWGDLNLDGENRNRDARNLEYYFKYQFTTSKGEIIIGTSKVTEEDFLIYYPGSEIMIKYSSLNPSENRIDDSRFVPFLLCTYIPFILICLFILVAGKEMINF